MRTIKLFEASIAALENKSDKTFELQFTQNGTSFMGKIMRSTITERGQTVIPAAIRRQFHLSPADRLEWVSDNGFIRVVPVRVNPIEAFRGQGAGGATGRLLANRRQDLANE